MFQRVTFRFASGPNKATTHCITPNGRIEYLRPLRNLTELIVVLISQTGRYRATEEQHNTARKLAAMLVKLSPSTVFCYHSGTYPFLPAEQQRHEGQLDLFQHHPPSM